MAIEPITTNTADSASAVTSSSRSDSTADFANTLALFSGSMSPAFAESLKYTAGDTAASIGWATSNAFYDASNTYASNYGSSYGLGANYATGGYTTSSYGSSYGTSSYGSSYGSSDVTDVESLIDEQVASNSYLMAMQLQISQIGVTYNALSNAQAAKTDAERKILANWNR